MMSFQALSATIMLSEEDTGTARQVRLLIETLISVECMLDTYLIPSSNDIHSYGQKVVSVLDSTLKHLGASHSNLADLGDKQAYNLREDPISFKLPATHRQADNTGSSVLSLDVFLNAVSIVLVKRNRRAPPSMGC